MSHSYDHRLQFCSVAKGETLHLQILEECNGVSCHRSRTMVAVHEAILADLLHPVDVVGRRWRYKTDGSMQTKVFMDAREKDKVESKLEAYSVVFKKLTGREVSFGFMTKYVCVQCSYSCFEKRSRRCSC